MKTIFENAGGKYEQQGDYALPLFKAEDGNEHYIGIWGQRYRKHLKTHHRILYYNYLTSGTLNQHIAEVDERANEMFNRLVKELFEKENITEKLKADSPLEWIRRTNNVRSRALEIVNSEVIFI